MKKWILAVLAVAAVAGAAGFLYVRSATHIDIPPYSAPPAELIHLEQGWTPQEWHEFHYTAQGTLLLPYSWFLALEQPCITPSNCGAFTEPEYLARFGFLRGEQDDQLNPDGLPIGFARQTGFTNPVSGQTDTVLGLTCAACHTGELHYQNYAVRIEGGPAMIEVGEFQKALGIALGLTRQFPFSLWRYGRFENKVLGDGASDADKAALKSTVDALIAAGKEQSKLTADFYKPEYEAGFARTDALTRIGNQVFALDMQNPANLAPATAPVRYPQLWDASWLDWVQYNSSIADPLVRNIGESLGVRAILKLYGDDAADYKNSVNVRGLKRLEDLLAGEAPYGGLTSPKWPAQFPALDQAKVAAGAELYGQLCQRCHLPNVAELQADLKSEQPRHWRTNALGLRLLRVTDVPLTVIGTDPNQAQGFKDRTADTGPLKAGTVSAGQGLELVTEAIAAKFFDVNNFTPEERLTWSGLRDPNEPAVRDLLVYKARPLNGIWAVAPYLHNGSVPNLYLMLKPEARPASFYTGSRKYDPVHVGYEYSELEGGYLYDTSRPGNGNGGHRFEGDGSNLGNGVIGRALSEDERWALIEYLKSI